MRSRFARRLTVAALVGSAAMLGTATAAHAAPSTPVSVLPEMTAGFSIDGSMPTGRFTQSFKTGLFNLTLGEGAEAYTTSAYCIEMAVPIDTASNQAGREAFLDVWDSFEGANKFSSNPTVNGVPTRDRVSWIAATSYPRTDVASLATAAGVTELSTTEAITASQAAIWHLTDGFELASIKNGDSHSQDWSDVKAVYDYLLGPANVGSPESKIQRPASLSINGPITGGAGSLVGPFTVTTNTHNVALSAGPSGAHLADATGAAFNGPVADGTQFFVQLPADLSAGTQVDVSATGMGGTSAQSSLVRTPGLPGYSHQQTLILSDTRTSSASASHTLQVAPALATPITVTTLAKPEIQVGEQAHDTATINGDVPAGATISFELFRQDSAVPTCTDAQASTDAVAVPAGAATNVTVDSPAVTITQPGTYFWVETLRAEDGSILHRGECGAAGETTIVKAAPATTQPIATATAPAAAGGGLAVTGTDSAALPFILGGIGVLGAGIGLILARKRLAK